MEIGEIKSKEEILREFKSIKIKRMWIFYIIMIASIIIAGKYSDEDKIVIMCLTLNYFLIVIIGVSISILNKKMDLLYKLCEMEVKSE